MKGVAGELFGAYTAARHLIKARSTIIKKHAEECGFDGLRHLRKYKSHFIPSFLEQLPVISGIKR